ncbi:hypothetical protein A5888_003836 [Enterococcus sp. 9E7_DIV0242]|uniref:Uncharacterized protein n=1 Tax=Candidatus Enterococcus clewellii TaxID=1834193 RepID=A0A242K604_9ENTE|nr:hypothetical protein A5888_001962 [Enterococcus sp. 9E7_DIV0242]
MLEDIVARMLVIAQVSFLESRTIFSLNIVRLLFT